MFGNLRARVVHSRHIVHRPPGYGRPDRLNRDNIRGMDPEVALARCGGAARWGRLRAMGVSERALRQAGRSGAVSNAGRGGYALPTAPPGLVAAVRLGGVASHVTAAKLHGLAGWAADEVHVTIPLGSSREAPDVVVHRAALGSAEVKQFRPVTGFCVRCSTAPDT